MRKENTLFWFLRTLVRQGELRPAYARQIYEKYMSGKKIPFGHALWLGRGWAYDQVVWGSKEAAKGYYDKYRNSPYCPVGRLPSIPGYDRRAEKSKIFGLRGRKKIKEKQNDSQNRKTLLKEDGLTDLLQNFAQKVANSDNIDYVVMSHDMKHKIESIMPLTIDREGPCVRFCGKPLVIVEHPKGYLGAGYKPL